MGMKQRKHAEHVKRRLSFNKNITLLIGAFWAASCFLFLDTMSRLSGSASLVTGFLVSEGAAEAAKPAGNSLISAGVYFLGMVIFGGAIFAVSRHSQQLRLMLKMEKEDRIITGSPKQALIDFFTILSNWSIKNTTPDIVIDNMNDIRESERKELPALSKVSFGLSKDEDILIEVSGEPSWDETKAIFATYISGLCVDKDKMLNIADYLGKNDVGTILCRMEDENRPAAGEAPKADKKKALPGKPKASKKSPGSGPKKSR
jgi:hypothetical protein